ncbi:MAG TPA: hypothetical protein VFW40_08150 [Capsulimonadaceae bacterium]|nr:hypothetical protein [Capsulimonadaceae bacterium]
MKRTFWIIFAAVCAVAVVAAVVVNHSADSLPQAETFHLHDVPVQAVDSPGMLPWRDPKGDMRTFFPSATGYRLQPVAFSGIVQPIQQRLGSQAKLKVYGVYVYTILRHNSVCGTVSIQQADGEYGVIEVVVALNNEGRIAGVRLQRYREPDAIAKALTAPSWLAGFRGKDENSSLSIGDDIGKVPQDAMPSAQAVVGTVRSLVIELAVARQNGIIRHA